VTRLSELFELEGARVEISGIAEPVQALQDPLSGQACVAIDYRAWPPSTTLGVDGASAHNGRAYELAAFAASDFHLQEGPVSVLVRVEPGRDTVALHDQLQLQFGVGLRAETDVVPSGARVCVAGRVEPLKRSGSPHRTQPHTLVVKASRIWLAPPDSASPS